MNPNVKQTGFNLALRAPRRARRARSSRTGGSARRRSRPSRTASSRSSCARTRSRGWSSPRTRSRASEGAASNGKKRFVTTRGRPGHREGARRARRRATPGASRTSSSRSSSRGSSRSRLFFGIWVLPRAADGEAARRARRRRAHVDRQVEGEGLRRDRHEGDLRRRGGRRRGEGGAEGDRRVPEGPEGLRPARRADAEGRAARRAARHRQDAPREGGRRRGGRAVLLHLRLRVRGDVRRRGRGPRARPVRAGPREGAAPSSSSTSSTRSAAPAPRCRAWAAATTRRSRR